MNIHQLVIFKKVVELGNFSRAAEAMGLTGMAVGKQIKALEAELKITLFERHTRVMRLTEIGKVIYQKALSAIDKINEIEDCASTFKKQPVGNLSIVCHTGISETLLLPFLTEFLEKYPKVDLKLSIQSISQPELIRDFDIIFGVPERIASQYYENWRCRQLDKIRLKLCASTQYLKKYGYPKKIEDLSAHHYLYKSDRIYDGILERCRERNVCFKKIISFDDNAALIYSAENHMGMGLIPDFVFDKKYWPQETKLEQLTHICEEQETLIYLLHKATDFQQPKITVFIKYILEKITN